MKIIWPTTCVFTTFFGMFSSNLNCSSIYFHHIVIFRPQLVLFYGVIHVVLKHKIEVSPPPPPPPSPPPVHILYRKNGTFYKECTIWWHLGAYVPCEWTCLLRVLICGIFLYSIECISTKPWPTTCVFTTFFDMFSSNLNCSSIYFHHIMIFRPQLLLFYAVIDIIRMHKIEDPPPPPPRQYAFCIGKMVLFIRSVRFGDPPPPPWCVRTMWMAPIWTCLLQVLICAKFLYSI